MRRLTENTKKTKLSEGNFETRNCGKHDMCNSVCTSVVSRECDGFRIKVFTKMVLIQCPLSSRFRTTFCVQGVRRGVCHPHKAAQPQMSEKVELAVSSALACWFLTWRRMLSLDTSCSVVCNSYVFLNPGTHPSFLLCC